MKKRKAKKIPSEPEEAPEVREQRESTKRNKEFFLDVLAKSRGIITAVSERTNISRATYYRWRNEDPEFAAKVDEILNSRADFLEDRLFLLASDGNIAALKYLLDKLRYNKKEKQEKKESEVHIYHHVDKPQKGTRLTMEDIMDNPELFRIDLEHGGNLSKEEIDEIIKGMHEEPPPEEKNDPKNEN